MKSLVNQKQSGFNIKGALQCLYGYSSFVNTSKQWSSANCPRAFPLSCTTAPTAQKQRRPETDCRKVHLPTPGYKHRWRNRGATWAYRPLHFFSEGLVPHFSI